MQVQSINNQPTNFGALKSVEIQGRFLKKNPQVSKSVLEKLKSNEVFQKFAEKHDVNLVLKSYDDGLKTIGAAFFYKKVAEKGNNIFSKAAAIIHSLLGASRMITEQACGYSYEEVSNEFLKRFEVNPSNCIYPALQAICDATDADAAEKASKMAQKEKAATEKAQQKHKIANNQSQLAALINEMTNK